MRGFFFLNFPLPPSSPPSLIDDFQLDSAFPLTSALSTFFSSEKPREFPPSCHSPFLVEFFSSLSLDLANFFFHGAFFSHFFFPATSL